MFNWDSAFVSVALRDQADELRRGGAAADEVWRQRVGELSADGSAVIGHDGWFFVHSGSNQWYEQSQGRLRLTPAGLNAWLSLLTARRERFASWGMPYAHVFTPEKVCVYPEFYPEEATLSAIRPVTQLLPHTGPEVIYPLRTLRMGKTLAPTHFRTDSHWTWFGAYLVYRELMQRFGLREPSLPPGLIRKPMPGDLSVKYTDAALENMHELDDQAWLVSKNDDQVPDHVGRIKVYRNPDAPNACRLLLIGDSYLYGYNLGAWFAASCQEVHCMWLPGPQRRVVESVKPDIVITQMAERFAMALPSDWVL